MDSIILKTKAGRPIEYVTDSVFCFGDYGGSGAIGAANIRTIVETVGADYMVECSFGNLEYLDVSRERYPRIISTFDSFGHRSVYVRRDVFDHYEFDVSDYPILNDEDHFRIEMEWQAEYMTDAWLVKDLFDSIQGRELSDAEREILGMPDDCETVRDWIDELPDNNSVRDAWYSLESFAADRGDYLEWLNECTSSLTPSGSSCAKVCAHFGDWVLTRPRADAIAAGQTEFTFEAR